MPSTAITRLLLVITLAGCSLTVLRLFWSGLFRRYPAFTAFFAFRAVDHIWPLFLPQKSALYAWFWIVTEPLLRVFCVFAVLELYRLMLERYKGLYSLGRWVLYGVSAISVVVSLLMLLPQISPAMHQRTAYLGYAWGFDRGVDFTLTIFILLSLAFISQYPISLSRNLVVHAALYSVFFLSSGTYALVRRAVWRHSAPVLDLVFSGVVAACTLAWFLLLSPKGEGAKAARIRFSPEYEARVLEKLDALNQVLIKSARS
jgi:hypothetical protein